MTLYQQIEQRRERAEWERELAEARRVAQERGLDEAAIDRAVTETRYGR